VSQLRLNPLTGRWVTLALERAARPGDLTAPRLPVESGPPRRCPFCPGNEEETPPALEVYGPAGQWLIRVVPNLYPAFSGTAPMRVEALGSVWAQAPGSGIHELLVLSPSHHHALADLDDQQAGLVMAALRDRFEDHGRYPAIHYSQAIVNHGREAGASLAHPHGQLLGMPFVPGELVEELNGFARFDRDRCLLCATWADEVDAGHRVVLNDDRVTVVCPFWSGAPYEMLIVPKAHGAHLARAAPRDLAAVGHALRTTLGWLERAIDDPPYNVVFHTAPHHEPDPWFHWHVHVVPRVTSIAGFEQGTGVMINIVPPEMAARHLTAVTSDDAVLTVEAG
jgi:UDPglucose--hexose-1-phosphate uridylyltransferase